MQPLVQKKRFSNSLFMRLVLFFLLSMLFAGGVTWAFQSELLVSSVSETENEHVISLGSQMASAVLQNKDALTNFTVQLSHNRELSNAISQPYEKYYDVWEAAYAIKLMFRERLRMETSVVDLQVYHTNQKFCEDGEYLFRMEKLPQNTSFLTWQYVSNGKYSICTEIHNTYHAIEGVLRVVVNTAQEFGGYLQGGEDTYGVLLLDEQWRILASSHGSMPVELDVIKALQSDVIYRDTDRNMIYYLTDVDGQWKVAVAHPMSTHQEERGRAALITLFVLLVYCVVIGSTVGVFVLRIFKRIRRIGRRMEDINRQRIRQVHAHDAGDEVSQLEWQYDQMAVQLENTIDKIAEARSKEARLYANVLESQINPHFLYNTLSVLRWKAMEVKSTDMCVIIDDMTTFYRKILNRRQSLMSVHEEMELIGAYLQLQQARHNHCVDIAIHVDEAAHDILVPKMLLQPLIENVYVHGGIILPGHQKIWITINCDTDLLQITIQDNGVGMNPETLNHVNHRTIESGKHGVGISFIHDLLELYYGTAASLHFESTSGIGTTVHITLPTMPSVSNGTLEHS